MEQVVGFAIRDMQDTFVAWSLMVIFFAHITSALTRERYSKQSAVMSYAWCGECLRAERQGNGHGLIF